DGCHRSADRWDGTGAACVHEERPHLQALPDSLRKRAPTKGEVVTEIDGGNHNDVVVDRGMALNGLMDVRLKPPPRPEFNPKTSPPDSTRLTSLWVHWIYGKH